MLDSKAFERLQLQAQPQKPEDPELHYNSHKTPQPPRRRHISTGAGHSPGRWLHIGAGAGHSPGRWLHIGAYSF